MEELRECPFCGRGWDNNGEQDVLVHKDNCVFRGTVHHSSDFGPEFIDHWNTRTEDKEKAELVDALEKLARLGNGESYGNSDGNIIAIEALAKVKGE